MSFHANSSAPLRYHTPPHDSEAHKQIADTDLSKTAIHARTHQVTAWDSPFQFSGTTSVDNYQNIDGFYQRERCLTGRATRESVTDNRPYVHFPTTTFFDERRQWETPPYWTSGAHSQWPCGSGWQWQQPQVSYSTPPNLQGQTQWYANSAYTPCASQSDSLTRCYSRPVKQQDVNFDPTVPAFTPVNAAQEQFKSPQSNERGSDKSNAFALQGLTRKQKKLALDGIPLQAGGTQSDATTRKRCKKPKPKSTEPTVRQHVMQQPVPTAEYLSQANCQPVQLPAPRRLLVILDLNGTLLFRKKHSGSNSFIRRPHIDEFLSYLFQHHEVMVWSSARPENVTRMCLDLFSADQRAQLVAIWARDKLGLTDATYNQKVQVYKQLSWIWADRAVQEHRTWPQQELWSQRDTVLVDDSFAKAASEPHNLIEVAEFEGQPVAMDEDLLAQLAAYLDVVSGYQDVSAYMRSQPFKYVGDVAKTAVLP